MRAPKRTSYLILFILTVFKDRKLRFPGLELYLGASMISILVSIALGSQASCMPLDEAAEPWPRLCADVLNRTEDSERIDRYRWGSCEAALRNADDEHWPGLYSPTLHQVYALVFEGLRDQTSEQPWRDDLARAIDKACLVCVQENLCQ